MKKKQGKQKQKQKIKREREREKERRLNGFPSVLNNSSKIRDKISVWPAHVRLGFLAVTGPGPLFFPPFFGGKFTLFVVEHDLLQCYKQEGEGVIRRAIVGFGANLSGGFYTWGGTRP